MTIGGGYFSRNHIPNTGKPRKGYGLGTEYHTKASLAKLGAENALMIGGAELDSNLVKAASNLPFVDVLPQQGINVYDILRRDVLVLSKDAAAHIEERLK